MGGTERRRRAESIDAAAILMQALGYRLRLRVVVHLLDGDATGVELSQALQVAPDALARHLRHLRVAGVVHRRTAGNRRLFSLAPGIDVLVGQILAHCRPAASSSLNSGWQPPAVTVKGML